MVHWRSELKRRSLKTLEGSQNLTIDGKFKIRPCHGLAGNLLLALVFCGGAMAALPPASTCFGTTSNGRLEDGKKLPDSGANFLAYSAPGVLAGRTYAHSGVVAAVTQAYKTLESTAPAKVFVYGESGWANGGRFRPHRTHQNGLSVDFMVPVLDGKGRSVPLPTSAGNKYGYGIEFDRSGKWGDLQIDFEALSAHLRALHQAANDQSLGIGLVILDPDFLPHIEKTRHGPWVLKNLNFMKSKPWVRHDDHYHVDFVTPCRPLK